jgi:hypothetical protein
MEHRAGSRSRATRFAEGPVVLVAASIKITRVADARFADKERIMAP